MIYLLKTLCYRKVLRITVWMWTANNEEQQIMMSVRIYGNALSTVLLTGNMWFWDRWPSDSQRSSGCQIKVSSKSWCHVILAGSSLFTGNTWLRARQPADSPTTMRGWTYRTHRLLQIKYCNKGSHMCYTVYPRIYIACMQCIQNVFRLHIQSKFC